MKSLEPLEEIATDPYGYARRWKKKTGRPVIGYLCSYIPEEILHAAGALPFRLFGGSADASAADAHLQAYSCGLARGVLADALANRLDFLSGAVFPHTCDTVQRLSDLWRINAGFSFHADVVLPVKLDTESARIYLEEVFRRFAAELEAAFGVPVTDERLAVSAGVFNRIRADLARLYRVRRERPGALAGGVLDTALRAAMTADRDELAPMLALLADEAETAAAGAGDEKRKRLVLSGGLCRMPEIYRVVESAGGAVVDDDLCTGRRFFDGTLEIGNDPLAAVAARYADRVVCPSKHRGNDARRRHLLEQVRESRADGVVFLLLKFCDPHGFDYPHLKDALDGEGIPSLLLEMEDPAVFGAQAVTRIEAFIENL